MLVYCRFDHSHCSAGSVSRDRFSIVLEGGGTLECRHCAARSFGRRLEVSFISSRLLSLHYFALFLRIYNHPCVLDILNFSPRNHTISIVQFRLPPTLAFLSSEISISPHLTS